MRASLANHIDQPPLQNAKLLQVKSRKTLHENAAQPFSRHALTIFITEGNRGHLEDRCND